MGVDVTLLRHGETTANAARVWQGHSNSGFTPAGREQVKRVAERLRRERFDLVISSDLGRAMATAGALGIDFETDRRWREIDLGSWEGLTSEEIERTGRDALAALQRGEDVRLGGGEKVSEAVARMSSALDRLIDRLDDGQRALVVGHGGSLLTLLSSLMRPDNPQRLIRLTNTAVSRVQVDHWGTRVDVYNDTTHLPGTPLRIRSDSADVVLVRHGQTEANVEGRWQGHGDGALTDEGKRQAERLAGVFPSVAAIYSSPLSRAHATATAVAARQLVEVEVDDRLCEIGFGSWEGLTYDEIKEADPQGLRDVFGGVDVPRGGSGETFATVGERMARSIEGIADRHPASRSAVVSHGGSIRAYIAKMLGIEFGERHRLSLLRNSAMTRVAYGPDGPVLAAWNLAPHLDLA